MDQTTLKARLNKWVKRVGPKQAQVALVTAGIGVSTAEKLVAGTYVSTPKGETAFRLERLLEDEEDVDGQVSA